MRTCPDTRWRTQLAVLLLGGWLTGLCWGGNDIAGARGLVLSLPATLPALAEPNTNNHETALRAGWPLSASPWDDDNPFLRPREDVDEIVIQLWLEQHSGDYKRYVNGSAIRVIMRKALSHWWYRERHSKFEVNLTRFQRHPLRQVSPPLTIRHYWVNLSQQELEFNFKLEF